MACATVLEWLYPDLVVSFCPVSVIYCSDPTIVFIVELQNGLVIDLDSQVFLSLCLWRIVGRNLVSLYSSFLFFARDNVTTDSSHVG